MSFIFTSYFDRFPDFDHRPRRSIRIEFNRLAKAQKWDIGETKRERATCYNEELEGHFHRLGITDQLERLKHLCDELDVKPRNNVAGCRKVLRHTHVNLIDLMDARRYRVRGTHLSGSLMCIRILKVGKSVKATERRYTDNPIFVCGPLTISQQDLPCRNELVSSAIHAVILAVQATLLDVPYARRDEGWNFGVSWMRSGLEPEGLAENKWVQVIP